MYQQGDVIIIPIESIPEDLEKKREVCVLQEGEMTGHAHRLHGEGFEVYAPRGVPYNNDTQRKHLKLVTPVYLKHEEHKEIKLPPGNYEIRIIREYDHFAEESRRVSD